MIEKVVTSIFDNSSAVPEASIPRDDQNGHQTDEFHIAELLSRDVDDPTFDALLNFCKLDHLDLQTEKSLLDNRHDPNAQLQLIAHEMRMVFGIGSRFAGKGMPFKEIIGEGIFALWESIQDIPFVTEEERFAKFARSRVWHTISSLFPRRSKALRDISLTEMMEDYLMPIDEKVENDFRHEEIIFRDDDEETDDNKNESQHDPVDLIEAINKLSQGLRNVILLSAGIPDGNKLTTEEIAARFHISAETVFRRKKEALKILKQMLSGETSNEAAYIVIADPKLVGALPQKERQILTLIYGTEDGIRRTNEEIAKLLQISYTTVSRRRSKGEQLLMKVAEGETIDTGIPAYVKPEYIEALPYKLRQVIELLYGTKDGIKRTLEQVDKQLNIGFSTVYRRKKEAELLLQRLHAGEKIDSGIPSYVRPEYVNRLPPKLSQVLQMLYGTHDNVQRTIASTAQVLGVAERTVMRRRDKAIALLENMHAQEQNP